MQESRAETAGVILQLLSRSRGEATMSHTDIQRTALVTGASRGLGSAIAREQAAAGANVAVNYFKSDEAAERICGLIQQNGGRAHPFKADVRDEGEVARLVQEVLELFGGIDILIVNATGPQPFLSIEEQTWESYLDQLEEDDCAVDRLSGVWRSSRVGFRAKCGATNRLECLVQAAEHSNRSACRISRHPDDARGEGSATRPLFRGHIVGGRAYRWNACG